MWCAHPHQESSSDVVNGVTSVLLTVDLSWPLLNQWIESPGLGRTWAVVHGVWSGWLFVLGVDNPCLLDLIFWYCPNQGLGFRDSKIRASRFLPCSLPWFDQRSTQVNREEYWRHSIHNITGVLLMRMCASYWNIEVNLNLNLCWMNV